MVSDFGGSGYARNIHSWIDDYNGRSDIPIGVTFHMPSVPYWVFRAEVWDSSRPRCGACTFSTQRPREIPTCTKGAFPAAFVRNEHGEYIKYGMPCGNMSRGDSTAVIFKKFRISNFVD